MALLEVKNVSKSFFKHKIYQNFNFTFESGHYCLKGKNGTGKSVFLEMLAGVLLQDAGLIFLENVGANSSIRYKKQLTYVPSKPQFFPATTGREFLNFIASVKNASLTKKMDEIVSGFHLEPHLETKFENMSLGTQKKLFLATLAFGRPSLIVLDEPTNGLDEESCRFLALLLRGINEGAILIVATHDSSLFVNSPHTILNLNTTPNMIFEVEHKESVDAI